jgi:Ca2+-binding EF-hand superfamily protein
MIDLKALYSLVDISNQNKIFWKDCEMLIKALGFFISNSKLVELKKSCGLNDDVSFEQFKKLAELSSKNSKYDVPSALEAFSTFAAKNDKASIDSAYFRRIIAASGEKLTEEELKEISQDSGLFDKNGKCVYEQFIQNLLVK